MCSFSRAVLCRQPLSEQISFLSQKKRSWVMLHLKAPQCTAVSSPGALSRVDCLKSSCRTKYPGFARKRDPEVCICAVYPALFSSKSLSRPNFCHQCPATSSQRVSYCLTVLLHCNSLEFTAMQGFSPHCKSLQCHVVCCRYSAKQKF